jgi:hypothetical protein
MIDHLEEHHATVLVWAALGGGSIALPYLEQEAYGEIDARLRFYGFVNDAEFIAACGERGIKVFGIVFEVQGWEFPVELNDAEDRILALNETRGVGKRDWLGLREFCQNRYPKLWRPFEHYFPGGLVNSDGEPVTDLLEEACSRDIYGVPCHAHWVECPDREHFCYTMDRNNPVWREYLKAVIRLQIDAGVHGVQLDEAELPLTTLQYGGCFCKDCMKGFRAYLQGLPLEALPEELSGEHLAAFHYGQWLLARGFDFKRDRESTPLFGHYLRFQRAAITRYFGELADYARQYAASRGRDVLVSGNFFNALGQYYALEPKVDLIITEMRNTRYRQPAWYRYVAGFAGPKPVVVVENPYGGVIPELVAKLKAGKGHDLFRMSLYEAAALGANMSVPYGAWLGSIEKDAFYPPHDLCVEIQSFLAEIEHLFSRQTWNEIGVIYSVESEFRSVARRSEVANDQLNPTSEVAIPFWQVCETLCNATQPYDVIFFPDGALRPDALTFDDFSQYRTVILPDCHFLSPRQASLLEELLAEGKRLLVVGSLGTNLPPDVSARILGHPAVGLVAGQRPFTLADLPDGPQVRVSPASNLMINVQRIGESAALHLIRYDFEPELDRTLTLPELTIDVRFPQRHAKLSLHSPHCHMIGELVNGGMLHRIRLRNVPLYSVVTLEPD